MARPTPSGTPANILISPAFVSWGGTDIGFADKVKINVKEENAVVMSDQTGKTPLSAFYTGNTITVELFLDEYTAPQLKKAFPQAALVGSGPYSLSFGKTPGVSYLSLAQALVISAASDDSSDQTRQWTMYLAVPFGDAPLDYKIDGKITTKVTFHCFPDLTKTNGRYLGFFGSSSAGSLTSAAFGSPTAGGGNTGNATMSAPTGSDTFTKTETWTATCIKFVSNASIWSVTGSVTGARGNATEGQAYHSNSITSGNSEINFTITHGATQSVAGDTITVTATAANYT